MNERESLRVLNDGLTGQDLSVGFGPVRSPPCNARMQQLSTTARDQSWNRQERLDKIPQRIWKQGGSHSRSRYLAQEDQV